MGAGLGAAIARLQEEEQALYGSYLAAKAAGSARASVYLKQWQSVVEQLRKVEADNPSIEREKENSISKDDLARVLGALRLLVSDGRALRADLRSNREAPALYAGQGDAD